MTHNIDVLVDVQFGDCGKGKISKVLLDKYQYDIVAKFNGGSNAGHAVWIDGEKHTAHHLTSGIYNPNALILIGPGCVVNPHKLFSEIEAFDDKFNVRDRVFVHPNTHIVTTDHIREEENESEIGTTRQGIGPCYSDKYRRTGIQAHTVPELSKYVRDFSELIYDYTSILMEGSQGWNLDIDHGNYPYVTSSHIHPAFAFATFALPMKRLRRVYGVAKVYETYVGSNKRMVSADEWDAVAIRNAGQEYGETTGRSREVGYINLNRLITSCNATGVETLVLNKLDVLEELGIFKLFDENGILVKYNTIQPFKEHIRSTILDTTRVQDVIFSGNKHGL